PKPSPTLPPTKPTTNPIDTARGYLTSWREGDYGGMHNLLSAASRKQYNRAYFVNRYTAIGEMATLQSVDVGLAPGSGEASQLKTQPLNIPIRVGMKTRRVGDIAETNVLPLVNEGGAWKVVWSPSLIFKDLSGNNLVRMYPQTPTRGGIYDRDGNPLAIDGQIAQLGVVPGQIKNETELLQRVSEALGVSRTYVKQRYSGGQPEWFMPISDLSAKEAADLRQKLANLAGVTFNERSGRVYPQGALMAQIIGYVGPIFAEDLEKPAYADYTANDVVGRTGLESWGESYLRGKPGGRLAIVAPDERLVKIVKEQTVQFGANIYLNIDINLQAKAEREMESKKLSGSVVAINPNNGEILTLVSQPSFDPNEFVTGISQARYAELTAPEARNPFQNRATGSSYPIASAFKPITMAAALTLPLAGVTTKIWVSDGTWNRDGGAVRGDWKAGGHGSVNLQQGITESVDTVFYDLGYELYQRDINYLTEFTKKWWSVGSTALTVQSRPTGSCPVLATPSPVGDRVTT
ncbi:MAG: penicillin-binding transpeptidase domain-containing protein, partial [Chloroflexia bacterium]